MTLSDALHLATRSSTYLNPPKSLWATTETDPQVSAKTLYENLQDPQVSYEDFLKGINQLRWVASRRRHLLKESFYYPLIAKLYEEGEWKNVREFGLYLKTLFNNNVPTKMRSAVMARYKGRIENLCTKYPSEFPLESSDEVEVEVEEYDIVDEVEVSEPDIVDEYLEDTSGEETSVEEILARVAEESIATPTPVVEDQIDTNSVLADVIGDDPTPIEKVEESDLGVVSLGGVVFKVHAGGSIKIGKVETSSISSENLKSLTVDRVEGGVLYGVAMSR